MICTTITIILFKFIESLIVCCSGPVSYTHLDVYKRQIPTNEEIRQTKGDTLWKEKLNEIKRFQTARVDRNLTNEQIAKLIKIYNK